MALEKTRARKEKPENSSKFNAQKEAGYIFIYDFDDTLYPSSYMEQDNIKDRDKLVSLDDKIHKLLSLSKAHGPVYVITNASESHVMSCIEKNLPKVFLMLDSINIISARDIFCCSRFVYKGDCIKWKSQAIRIIISKVLSERNTLSPVHLISVGDSDIDRLATIDASGYQSNNLVCKIIKLKRRPTLMTLYKQISALIFYMDVILANERGFDLKMCIEPSLVKSPGLSIVNGVSELIATP